MDETQRIFSPPTKKARDLKEELKKLSDQYIKNFNHSITISGGAVRDTILNYPIRDIDIYINDSCLDYFLKMLGAYIINKEECYSADNATQDEKEQYCHLPILRRFNIAHGVNQLDVLCMRENFHVSAENVSNLHTVGISQCGLDHDGLYKSSLFDKDMKDEMITMTKMSRGHAKSMKYFMKLWDKFHWPLRIAEKEEDKSFNVTLAHPVPMSGTGKIIHAPTVATTGASFGSWASMVAATASSK